LVIISLHRIEIWWDSVQWPQSIRRKKICYCRGTARCDALVSRNLATTNHPNWKRLHQ